MQNEYVINEKGMCKMLKIMFLIIVACIMYIFFPKIHLHEIVVEEFRLLKKESKLQAFIFYAFPIKLGILISRFPNVYDSLDKNMGNYMVAVSVFIGFFLNISVLLNSVISKLSEKGRFKEGAVRQISKEVNTVIHYSILAGLVFLMLCMLEMSFGYNRWIMILILIVGIHFLTAILMDCRALYLITKNTY